jgi:hypothetical protein
MFDEKRAWVPVVFADHGSADQHRDYQTLDCS